MAKCTADPWVGCGTMRGTEEAAISPARPLAAGPAPPEEGEGVGGAGWREADGTRMARGPPFGPSGR